LDINIHEVPGVGLEENSSLPVNLFDRRGQHPGLSPSLLDSSLEPHISRLKSKRPILKLKAAICLNL